jgi:ribonucleotide reductase beta subunit family protein with ferritin-like domain
MIIRGKNIGNFNEKKFQNAVSLMTRDYVQITRKDRLYFSTMSKKEELAWENERISDYYNNFKAKELEEMLKNWEA